MVEKKKGKQKILMAIPSTEKRWYEGHLTKYAEYYWIQDVIEDMNRFEALLPEIDCLVCDARWPSVLDARHLSMLKNLKFIQSEIGGVSQIPVDHLDKRVIIASNVGAYATEVSEYAFALLLAAAKGIPQYDSAMKTGTADVYAQADHFGRAKLVSILKDKSVGILGYGNIGKGIVPFARSFGMNVFAFVRHKMPKEKGVTFCQGVSGLNKILKECDSLILCLPLTKFTRNIINRETLAKMKDTAIIVNVGRGELVEPEALYEHLSSHPEFIYATDIWWAKDGRESFSPDFPFFKLSNFIGTPHVSGPSARRSGGMAKTAMENLERYLSGKKILRIVDKSEYLS